MENEYAYCITGFNRFLQNVMKIPLRSPYFEHVKSGLKTVDARIFFPKYRRLLHPGDVLKFVNSDTKTFILKKLTSMKPYDTFELLLKTEGVRSCLPNLKDGDVDAGVQLYHSFKANGESYVELEPKYKVIALRLGDVCTIPHRPVTRTNMTDLGQVVIPPSTRSQLDQLTERVLKANQEMETEKERSRFLIDTQNKLKVQLENTKRTLAQVILDRDEARETIRYLRERNNELLRHVLSENAKFRKKTVQLNEGTVQKRTRLSEC